MFKKFPFYQQLNQADCGPACLKMILQFYGKSVSIDRLRDSSNLSKSGASIQGLSEAADVQGLASRAIKTDFTTLVNDIPLPAIAYWEDNHFIVLHKINNGKIYVADPALGLLTYRNNDFLKGWYHNSEENQGILLLLSKTARLSMTNELQEDNEPSVIFYLKGYFSKYSNFWLRLLSAIVIIALLQFTFPFLTQALVDQGIKNEDLSLIYIVLISQLVLFFSQSFAEVLRSWLLLHVGNRISFDLIAEFFNKLFKLKISFFDTKTVGDLFQRLSDTDRIEMFITSNSVDIIFSLISFSVYLLVLYLYDTSILLVFFFSTMLFIIWIILFQKKRALLERHRFKILSKDMVFTHELIYGIQEIKLNLSENRRRSNWESNRIKYFNLTDKILTINQYQNIGGKVINELKNLIITFLAVSLVISGEITLGMLLAIQFILGQLNAPLLSLTQFIQSGQDAQLSFNRLMEFGKNEEENIIDSPFPEILNIHFNDVSFRYHPEQNYVIKNISLTIPTGKTTAIVGVSGSGKTTILKLILGFYSPTDGNILVGNFPLNQINQNEWLSKCGVVMQDGYIFTDTILNNITEGTTSLDDKRLWTVIQLTNLNEFIADLPRGLNTEIGASGLSLSGGQKQRILIARAFYKDPQFLFFDEATSSLDSQNELHIVKNISKHFSDRTMIVIAHRLSTVKKADQILVVDNGEIVEVGKHQELIDIQGKYFSLIRDQLELG